MDPITEAPMLEAIAWESATVAAADGDGDRVAAMGDLLARLGYELTWDGAVLTLRHQGTVQELRRRLRTQLEATRSTSQDAC